MKRDRAHVVGEYLALLEKGDQAALIDFLARHSEEMGSLGLLVTQAKTQASPSKRKVPILESIVLVALVLFSLTFIAVEVFPSLLGLGIPHAATLAQIKGIALGLTGTLTTT